MVAINLDSKNCIVNEINNTNFVAFTYDYGAVNSSRMNNNKNACIINPWGAAILIQCIRTEWAQPNKGVQEIMLP